MGINEPYAMTDATDYTLPVHAERRGLPYVGIEIRRDLIADERGQQAWAKRFARLLPQARNAGKFDFRNIPRDDNRKEYVRRH